MKGKYSDAIAKIVKREGTVDTHTLKQLGYTQQDIEKAVRDGVVKWNAQGRLTAK